MKSRELYAVSVTLSDGQTLLCNLLCKPTAAVLAAVAAAKKAPEDFGKVLALAGNIAIPVTGDKTETTITIVNTVVGTVRVETQEVYGVPDKRPRQPKADTPAADKPKRGRKPRNPAPAETSAIVTPDTATTGE